MSIRDTVLDWMPGILARRFTKEPRYTREHQAPERQRTLAGVVVTPDTAPDNPVLNAAVRYIRDSTAGMPWRVFEKTKAGNRQADAHPIDWLLWKRPNPEWSSFQFRETLIHWAILWGNGYAEIERDTAGRPFALWPVHPDRVEPCRDSDNGKLFYEVDNGTGGKVDIPMEDMFHIRGFGHGPVGIPLTSWAAQTLGWARAAELFGASFFGNGMNLSGVVTNKKGMSPDGVKRQRAELESLYKGPWRSNRVAILDADSDWKAISSDPQKSQLVEVHRFLVEAVCRLTGVPPHIVADLSRSTNNNIEHQGIEAVQRCLMPWCKRFEDEADYKLFGENRRGFFTKINMLGLLRGDFKSQAEGFKIYREMAVLNADEIRERLDMNRMDAGLGGEKYTMNGSYQTLERIGEDPPAPPTPSAPTPEPDPTDPAEADAMNAIVERAAAMEPANAG